MRNYVLRICSILIFVVPTISVIFAINRTCQASLIMPKSAGRFFITSSRTPFGFSRPPAPRSTVRPISCRRSVRTPAPSHRYRPAPARLSSRFHLPARCPRVKLRFLLRKPPPYRRHSPLSVAPVRQYTCR